MGHHADVADVRQYARYDEREGEDCDVDCECEDVDEEYVFSFFRLVLWRRFSVGGTGGAGRRQVIGIEK